MTNKLNIEKEHGVNKLETNGMKNYIATQLSLIKSSRRSADFCLAGFSSST